MKKFTKQKYVLLIILLALSGSYYFFFADQENNQEVAIVTYDHQVVKGRMADSLLSSVSATARNKVALSFGLSGEVAQIFVGTGDILE